MSVAPGYFEILNQLDQAVLGKAQISGNNLLSDQSWIDIPLPPAPAGLQDFPLNPEAHIVATKPLPDREVFLTFKIMGIEYNLKLFTRVNQSISVIGYYTKIVQAIVTPEMPFRQTMTVTKGTSRTESFSAALEVSMGGTIKGILNLGAKVSTTFGKSITFSEAVTESHQFELSSKSGSLNGIWWQAVYEYHLNGYEVWEEESGQQSRPFSEVLYDSAPIFVARQYPPA